MKIINQYSAIWMSAIFVVVIGFFLLRRDPKWPQFLAVVGLVLFLVAAWFVLRPRQSTDRLDAAQVQVRIGQGMPVLLELQSPY
jgi:hypothetical protein